MITEGQRLLITNMVNTELNNINNSVYCENELIALKKALNIDDVSKSFYCLDAGIKGEKHLCKKQCDTCKRVQQ